MTEEPKYRARILSRRDATTYTQDAVSIPVKDVMYSTPFLTPSIVRIRLDEYSAESEARAIREDIDKRHSEQPEIRQV
jgi:hypothetical protein